VRESDTRPGRVVFAILDAFPHTMLDADTAPNLHALARDGGHAPHGGRAVLSASTYPNHASFVTGAAPSAHGIYTSRVLVEDAFVPAQEVGPQAPTLFERCRDAGRRSIAALGDQNLVGVCGAHAADAHWPPEGALPEDAPRGALGYAADRAVLAALDALDLEGAELAVLQLDEVDTARHLHGPAGEATLEQCRATDAVFGEILERLRPHWEETIVIAVSDHEHEAVSPGAIDLAAETRARGLDLHVDHDGTAALVVGEVAQSVLRDLPGVSETATVGPDRTLVWGEPGHQFGIDWGLAAQHGSPRTAAQLAVVGGGHAGARSLAARIEAAPPPATAWAQWITDLLEIT
jgi:hypothetical protein